jgi:hypothetical protein
MDLYTESGWGKESQEMDDSWRVGCDEARFEG